MATNIVRGEDTDETALAIFDRKMVLPTVGNKAMIFLAAYLGKPLSALSRERL
jgi:hypothetical protein